MKITNDIQYDILCDQVVEQFQHSLPAIEHM